MIQQRNMIRVFYVHWNESELEPRVRELEGAGHQVRAHWSQTEHAALGDFQPEAVVISLDRLPSHGRAIAEWFWEAKKRQVIPLIFAGGKPEKVVVFRERFPGAIFCEAAAVPAVLAGLRQSA